MNRVSSLARQLMTCCLVTLLAAPAGMAQQTSDQGAQTAAPAASQPAPPATQSTPPQQESAPPSQQSTQSQQQGTPPQQQTAAPDAANPQNPPAPQQPVGSAAAPYEKGIGVGVSRPAGAAIAPAKQRRTRSFLIKTAVVIGAAVAVGVVIGLSNSSPSRPN